MSIYEALGNGVELDECEKEFGKENCEQISATTVIFWEIQLKIYIFDSFLTDSKNFRSQTNAQWDTHDLVLENASKFVQKTTSSWALCV